MKKKAIRSLRYWLILVLTGFGFQAKMFALPPHSREISGFLTKVNRQEKTLVLQTENENQAVQLKWNDRTQTFADGKEMRPGDLQPGARVRARYHAPIFGQKFTYWIRVDLRQDRPKGH